MKKIALFMFLLVIASLGVTAATPQIATTALEDQPIPVLIDERPVRSYDLDEKFEISVSETVYVDDITISFMHIVAVDCIADSCISQNKASFAIGKIDEDPTDAQAWASRLVSLGVGESVTVYGATVTLLALDNKATLVVSKDDNKYRLGEKFNLALGQNAIVDNLDIKFDRVDDICDTDYCPDAKAVFIVSIEGDVSATILLKVGETLTLRERDITLLAMDAQATLVVNRDDDRYKLGEKFELVKDESATVEYLTIKYLGLTTQVCADNEKCMPKGRFSVTMAYTRVGANVVKIAPSSGVIELNPGETKKLYGYSITLLALDSRTATLVVNKAKQAKTPVCSHIGTEREGWYIDGQLVKLDTCVCRAVCKGDAYYSTCNGQLIMKAACAESAPVGTESGVAVGSVTGGVVESSVPAAVSVPGSDGIIVEQQEDAVVYVSSAVGRAQPSMKVESVTLIQEDRPYYEVKGTTKGTFLWIFPREKETTLHIDAESYELIE